MSLRSLIYRVQPPPFQFAIRTRDSLCAAEALTVCRPLFMILLPKRRCLLIDGFW